MGQLISHDDIIPYDANAWRRLSSSYLNHLLVSGDREHLSQDELNQLLRRPRRHSIANFNPRWLREQNQRVIGPGLNRGSGLAEHQPRKGFGPTHFTKNRQMQFHSMSHLSPRPIRPAPPVPKQDQSKDDLDSAVGRLKETLIGQSNRRHQLGPNQYQRSRSAVERRITEAKLQNEPNRNRIREEMMLAQGAVRNFPVKMPSESSKNTSTKHNDLGNTRDYQEKGGVYATKTGTRSGASYTKGFNQFDSPRSRQSDSSKSSDTHYLQIDMDRLRSSNREQTRGTTRIENTSTPSPSNSRSTKESHQFRTQLADERLVQRPINGTNEVSGYYGNHHHDHFDHHSSIPQFKLGSSQPMGLDASNSRHPNAPLLRWNAGWDEADHEDYANDDNNDRFRSSLRSRTKVGKSPSLKRRLPHNPNDMSTTLHYIPYRGYYLDPNDTYYSNYYQSFDRPRIGFTRILFIILVVINIACTIWNSIYMHFAVIKLELGEPIEGMSIMEQYWRSLKHIITGRLYSKSYTERGVWQGLVITSQVLNCLFCMVAIYASLVNRYWLIWFYTLLMFMLAGFGAFSELVRGSVSAWLAPFLCGTVSIAMTHQIAINQWSI